jgi:hypothetical protein
VLLAILIVPFIVLPETAFVDITSTPKTNTVRFFGSLLAGILLTRLAIKATLDSGWIKSNYRSLRESSATFFLLSFITAVVALSIISTLLSISPGTSLWGRNPAGFEAGAYTALMYVVFAIGTFITIRESGRESGSFDRVWATLAISGIAVSIIGIFQYHGIAFLDISQTHGTHATGTAGNPIFYGALLVLMAPISLAYLVQKSETSAARKKLYWLAGTSIVTGLYTVSLVTTVSRGPMLAWAAGLTVFILLALRYRSTGLAKKPIGVICVSTIAFVLLAAVYDPSPTLVPTPIAPISADGDDSAQTSEPVSIFQPVSQKFDKLTRSSTVRLRFQYWKLSTNISTERPEIPYSNNLPSVVRWLFGYGPDTFRYVATAESDSISFTARFTSAHNDLFNRWVEQGILGLVGWLGLWASIFFALWRLVKRHAGSGTVWIAVGLAGALTSRFFEQLTGSPTTGDVFIFWILVGILAAAVSPTRQPRNVEAEILAARVLSATSTKKLVIFPAVTVIGIAAIFLSWETSGRFFFANNAGSVLHGTGILSYEEAESKLKKATDLAPEVARYWHFRADAEVDVAEASTDPQVQFEFRRRAYEYEKRAYEANPLEIASHYDLAFAAWELAKLGDDDKSREVIELYERLTRLAPADALAAERLKILKDVVNQ